MSSTSKPLRLKQYLQKLTEQSLNPTEVAQLEAWVLADPRSAAFGITSATVSHTVQQRSSLLRAVYPQLSEFCHRSLNWQQPLVLLWWLWLPLAQQMIERRACKPLLIQGILGGQGTGKTTLTAVLTQILTQLGYSVAQLSLDDLYKTHADRQQLQQVDPRLRWRGPPGTHDVDLGLSVLQQLRTAHQPVPLPRFDKSVRNGAGDRTQPIWVSNVDFVLFEGWFVGIRPIDPQQFDAAPLPISTKADRAFARDCNARLRAYLPLWQYLDRLIVLLPTDYRFSQQWRRQAEQQMKALGRGGMDDAEVDEFVTYFWRSLHPELFLPPLLRDSEAVDLVIKINADHQPEQIYCPAAELYS